MKKILIIFTICITTIVTAQNGKWTWMKGDNIAGGGLGNYGTKGVAALTNEPPGRYQPAYWTDLNGNFWLYGGYSSMGEVNDLWKFDPLTNMWTWMSGFQGTSNNMGNYGPIGVPGVNYCPSARGYGTNCWTDKNNNLWLLGGTNSGDDLWKYDIATNEWTLVKGSNNFAVQPVYGVKGVPDINNTPGVIVETKSGYVDDQNNLWMIGNGTELLWRYGINNNQWTWMKGDNSMSSANFGVKGVEAATNQPISRYSYTKWRDVDGNFYIFAGLATGLFGSGEMNDVWKFNPNTNNWTWVSGTQVPNDNGTTPAKCTKNVADVPAARYENQTVSTVGCASAFWSFGGFRTDTSTFTQYFMNDLWLYDAKTNQWTFVGGDLVGNQVGNYGTKGVYASTNILPGRGGVGIWSDKQDNLWIFGGYSNGWSLTNDLWKFEPDTSCFKTSLSVNYSLPPFTDTVKCGNQAIVYSLPNTADFKIFPANNTYTFNVDTTLITFNPSVTTTYTLMGKDKGLCPGKDTLVVTILVVPPPNAAAIASPIATGINSPTSTFINQSTNAIKYEWYYKGVIVSTAKDYTATQSALGIYCYTLVAFNIQGCTDTTNVCFEITPDISVVIPNSFTPNGDGKNDVFKAITKNLDKCNFKIFNRYGETVFETTDPTKGWDGLYQGSKVADIGTYYYIFEYVSGSKREKVIKGDVSLIK